MKLRERPLAHTLGAVCIACAPGAVHAEDHDGLYGRLDHDTVLSAEVNGGLWSGTDVRASAGGVFRARYLDEVGLAVGYDHAVGGARTDTLWAGVDFRPMMLGRWTYDLEQGPRWRDLLVDSIGLDLGIAWLRPGETVGAGGGFGLLLGGGFEVPLTWSEGRGLTLRLSVRWIASQPWDVQGTGASDSAVIFTAGLVFRTTARSGLVGAH